MLMTCAGRNRCAESPMPSLPLSCAPKVNTLPVEKQSPSDLLLCRIVHRTTFRHPPGGAVKASAALQNDRNERPSGHQNLSNPGAGSAHSLLLQLQSVEPPWPARYSHQKWMSDAIFGCINPFMEQGESYWKYGYDI